MELEQKRIVYCRRQLAQTSACTETADCIVPDAFPDVGRVVYACGTAAIGDHAPQNGRLLISGTVQTVILYEPENGGGLRRLEVPLSFAHIEECAQLDSSSVCLVECRVSAVEASVVNSRKLSIAADLVLTAECYDKTACDYTENIADDHLELLSETCEAVLPDEAQLFSFSVLEDIPVEETDGLSLLKQSCTLQITECRAMRDRIVVRGEAALRCLVMQLDEAVRTISKTTPFTQVFELTGAVEEDTPDAQLTVRSLECRIAANHSLSCTVNADALVLLRRSHTLHCITDFERISDHSINVVESVQQMRKENLTFSRKGEEEMNLYGAAIRDILTRTTDAFVNNDQALAHTVEPLEEVIDELNKDVKKHHMKRLRKGKCSMELGLLLSDLAMNYERVADHCSNIAVYMMQLKDTQLEEHSFTEQLDEAESAEFTRLLDEFGSKYAL